jgi:hypothetical protein
MHASGRERKGPQEQLSSVIMAPLMATEPRVVSFGIQ